MPPCGANETDFFARPATITLTESRHVIIPGPRTMHFDAHQPVIDDLEARILTIRDSL